MGRILSISPIRPSPKQPLDRRSPVRSSIEPSGPRAPKPMISTSSVPAGHRRPLSALRQPASKRDRGPDGLPDRASGRRRGGTNGGLPTGGAWPREFHEGPPELALKVDD